MEAMKTRARARALARPTAKESETYTWCEEIAHANAYDKNETQSEMEYKTMRFDILGIKN